jgi:Amt family ammonium transporter
VVHSVGGWFALIGAIMLGPRLGKYDKSGKPLAIPGHSLSLATLGTFILWFGWFGFNPGSTMGADVEAISLTATNTNLAAAAGGIAATILSWIIFKKPDLSMALNGGLAGLVAITCACAFVDPWAAIVFFGFVPGVVVVLSVLMFDKIKIDDPVGAISVHGVCGSLGTVLLGLFHNKQGLLYSGATDFLFAQIVGVVSVFAFCVVGGLILFGSIKAIVGLRVSQEEEIEGLDIHEHGNRAYPDFVTTMSGTSSSVSPAIGVVGHAAHAAGTILAHESGK